MDSLFTIQKQIRRRSCDERTPLAGLRARLTAPPLHLATQVGFEPTSSCEHTIHGLPSGSRTNCKLQIDEVMVRDVYVALPLSYGASLEIAPVGFEPTTYGL